MKYFLLGMAAALTAQYLLIEGVAAWYTFENECTRITRAQAQERLGQCAHEAACTWVRF